MPAVGLHYARLECVASTLSSDFVLALFRAPPLVDLAAKEIAWLQTPAHDTLRTFSIEQT